jgi:hypothetical protein
MGARLAHRSPADAYGLTRCACQTAVEKQIQGNDSQIAKTAWLGGIGMEANKR